MDQFFKKVYPEPNTGCWLWAGGCHPSGHGSLSQAKKWKGLNYAHRFSYYLENGEFERSKLILHKCDVPQCVNPDHLYVGSVSDNTRDLIERGNPKWARGTQISTSKLNEKQVLEIKRLSSMYGISQRKLGKIFNVCHSTIGQILRGNRWKDC